MNVTEFLATYWIGFALLAVGAGLVFYGRLRRRNQAVPSSGSSEVRALDGSGGSGMQHPIAAGVRRHHGCC